MIEKNVTYTNGFSIPIMRGFNHVSDKQWKKDVGLGDCTDEEYLDKYEVENKKPPLPKRATEASAGYDIYSPWDIILEPNEEITVPTGIKVYMQPDEFFMIAPRSGQGFKFYLRLANTVGIIDSDYYENEDNEGHCWVKIRNEGSKVLEILEGDAMAQGIFKKYLLADGDELSGKKRSGGLGSTTKK